jgi:hypothetical protein
MPGDTNVGVTSMFFRRRDPAPCILVWLSHRLQGLQMGAMTGPNFATQTCPPTSALFVQPSKEHHPRVRPVARSASAIHELLFGFASVLPSTFHALTASWMRRVVAIASGAFRASRNAI